jgi:hypothetical protein
VARMHLPEAGWAVVVTDGWLSLLARSGSLVSDAGAGSDLVSESRILAA